jgi:hypothetical protein
MSFARVYRGFAYRIWVQRVWTGVQVLGGLVSIVFLTAVAAYCAGVRW